MDVDFGGFTFREHRKIAFFPGTFDPFTLSHKAIVQAIRDLGFEVYLAIDEFSWSKKTQPSLIRRQIASMSVADEFHVYIFPHNIPVNIANPSDLRRLKSLFPGCEVYLTVGSDVIRGASSYRQPPREDSVHSMNKAFYLPPRFCALETANDAGAAARLPGVDERMRAFAESIRNEMLPPPGSV